MALTAAQTGEAFAEPPRVQSENGVLQFDLVASDRGIDVAGADVAGHAYDENFVGPTLVVNPGDTIAMTLDNQLGTHTNVHFHGLHVSPSGNSDNIFLSIEPGEQFAYSLKHPRRPSRRDLLVPLARARYLGGAGVRRALGTDHRAGRHRAVAARSAATSRTSRSPSRTRKSSATTIENDNIDSNAPTLRTVNPLHVPCRRSRRARCNCGTSRTSAPTSGTTCNSRGRSSSSSARTGTRSGTCGRRTTSSCRRVSGSRSSSPVPTPATTRSRP